MFYVTTGKPRVKCAENSGLVAVKETRTGTGQYDNVNEYVTNQMKKSIINFTCYFIMRVFYLLSYQLKKEN